MNLRSRSSYGLRGGQQPKGRLHHRAPNNPKYPAFAEVAYGTKTDTAFRAAPKHDPSESYSAQEYPLYSRPKSAVSIRSRRTETTFSRKAPSNRPETAAHSRRSKARDLEHILEKEKTRR